MPQTKKTVMHRPYLLSNSNGRYWACPISVDNQDFSQELVEQELILKALLTQKDVSLNPASFNANNTATTRSIIGIALFNCRGKAHPPEWSLGLEWKIESLIAIEPVYHEESQIMWSLPKDILDRVKAAYHRSQE